jgi:catechol-2,3-dioxygenase
MAIKVRNVGHVVLKVQDIERAARFYRDVLGLKEVARGNFGRPMAFFSAGDNHHDVAVRRSVPTLRDPRRARSGSTTSRCGSERPSTSCGRRRRTWKRMAIPNFD